MGLFSMLVVVITDILVTTINIQLRTESTTSVATDGRYIYSRFIYDINRAETVVQPQNLGDSASTLQFTADSNNFTYGLNNGNLTITDVNGTYQLNSFDSSISDLTFQRIGNAEGKHTFRINFTVTGKTKSENQTEVKKFQTTAGLR